MEGLPVLRGSGRGIRPQPESGAEPQRLDPVNPSGFEGRPPSEADQPFHLARDPGIPPKCSEATERTGDLKYHPEPVYRLGE
jgi:hypothetical protein